MSAVLIVNMPFASLRWPNLGPSLLKAALARRKVPCDIAYLNFDFAERIGLERYTWIADCFAFVLGGEWLFARHFFPGQLADEEQYFREVLLASDPGLSRADLEDFRAVQAEVGPFLDHCMASIDWTRYAIVGFTLMFQQILASMGLARRIKAARPEVQILLGGAACEGPMGAELLRRFPMVDYVFSGEADLTFPSVVEQILSGRPADLPPGVLGRQQAPGAKPSGRGMLLPSDSPSTPLVRRMDDLPFPDFDDYFARLRASPLAGRIEPLLFFETSRGCWWGQKHHCKFCGLNGAGLIFRSKSPERVIDELRWLIQRYGLRRACSADNILDFRYFQTLLPMLREAGLGLGLASELKTNLTRPQIQLLLEAGLRAAQLGIETFLSPVLRLAAKGASGLQNLQTLKWFSEARIEVKWNLLYGFPGEDPADYATLAELLPALFHLAPPLAVGRVRLDRFSPYFEDPASYGIANPRPHPAFGYVFPFPEDSLARLAFYYQYEYADGRDPLQYAAPVLEAARTWQELAGTVTLRYWDRPDGVLILHDTRPCAAEFQRRLTGLAREIYLFCDTGRPLEKILKLVAQRGDPTWGDPGTARRLLDEWLAARLMVRLDGRYLSLALRAPSEVDSTP
ncbi:MAG: RiPP maturation radical SAM C-methyltransferase [Thermoguttaceae bacterium]